MVWILWQNASPKELKDHQGHKTYQPYDHHREEYPPRGRHIRRFVILERLRQASRLVEMFIGAHADPRAKVVPAAQRCMNAASTGRCQRNG